VGLSRAHGAHGGIGIKMRGAADGKQSTWTPAIDIRENDKEYIVVADVPGVGKEDLDVEFHDTLLVISGQNKQDPHNTTANSQQIGVDKDNQQPTGGHQYQQQPTGGHQYQQQSTGPQHQQQSTGPQYKQQSTGQQHEPHQFQDRKDKQPEYQQDRKDKQPEYQQDRKDKQPYFPAQPGEQQHYQQQPGEQQHYQQSGEQRYQQQPDEQRYQQQPDERRYQQQEPDEAQNYQHLPKYRQQTQGERIHIQERPYGYFSRSIQLPNNIKADDDFYANLSNGVLKIKIPKSNDKPRKKITIS